MMKKGSTKFDESIKREFWDEVILSLIQSYRLRLAENENKMSISIEESIKELKSKFKENYNSSEKEYRGKIIYNYKFILNELKKESLVTEEYERAEIYNELLKYIKNPLKINSEGFLV